MLAAEIPPSPPQLQILGVAPWNIPVISGPATACPCQSNSSIHELRSRSNQVLFAHPTWLHFPPPQLCDSPHSSAGFGTEDGRPVPSQTHMCLFSRNGHVGRDLVSLDNDANSGSDRLEATRKALLRVDSRDHVIASPFSPHGRELLIWVNHDMTCQGLDVLPPWTAALRETLCLPAVNHIPDYLVQKERGVQRGNTQ